MHKEILKKHLAEIKHYAYGGELLARSGDEYGNFSEWRQVDSSKNWSLLALLLDDKGDRVEIIQNDGFAPFRKAECDGNIIQYCKDSIWIDKLTTSEFECGQNYRVKPKPPFAIGDVVIYNRWIGGKQEPLIITNINCGRYYFKGTAIALKFDELEKWAPVEGDLCWFWDSADALPELGTFSHRVIPNSYASNKDFHYTFCEPYLGCLPFSYRHLRDKKDV